MILLILAMMVSAVGHIAAMVHQYNTSKKLDQMERIVWAAKDLLQNPADHNRHRLQWEISELDKRYPDRQRRIISSQN
jgi:biopolymer transport protein ExbB/TolQ